MSFQKKEVSTSKYKNIIEVVDGIKFRSRLEARRYGQLKMLLLGKRILKFERQKSYKLIVNGLLITTYQCDFVVYYPDGSVEIEDTKGVITKDFAIKMKLMKAVLGIEIKLIKK